ncbi:hypothetical protein D9M69_582780 [compost metagenome]
MLDSGFRVRETCAAADGEFRRRDFPFHAQFGEDVIAEVLSKRPERGPLPAYEAEDEGAAAAGFGGAPLDAVVA